VQDVEDKRKELIGAQKELDKAISERNDIIKTIADLTDKAQKNLETFEELIKEAEEKVNNSSYNQSKLWHALKTEYEKEATKLDLMRYRGRLEERKSTLEIVKSQLVNYQRKTFVDMGH
jgi:cellobiose-specific phosphotransferase system component IIA